VTWIGGSITTQAVEEFLRVEGCDCEGGNVSLISGLLDAQGATFNTGGNFITISNFSSLTMDPANSLIQLNNSSLASSGDLLTISAPAHVSLDGPLLGATDSNVNVDGSLINVTGEGSSLTSTSAQPLIQVDPSSVTAGVNIVQVSGGRLNLAGPLLDVTNSTMSSGAGAAFVSVNSGGQLHDSDSSGSALLSFSGSTVNAGANFFHVRDSGSHVTLPGPLLADNGSTFNTTNNFLRIAGGGSLTSTSRNPLISLSGTTFTGGQGPGTDTGGSILNMRTDAGDNAASTLTLAGPLLKATSTAFNSTDSNFINIRDNAILTSTTPAPLVELTGSTVTANNNIARVGPYATNDAGTTILGNGVPPSVTLAGPAFKATDTHFTAQTGSFLLIRDTVNGTVTGSGPFIQLAGTTSDGTTVTASQGNFLTLASPNNQPPTFSLPSSLLDATNTTFATGDPAKNDQTFLFVADGAKLSSSSADPLVRLSGSSLNTAGNFLTVRRSGTSPSTVNLSGPLLSASNSSFTTFNSVKADGCCAFLFVGEGGNLQGTGSDALLQFNTSTFSNIGGSFVNLTPTANLPDSTPAPSTMTLGGQLLNDSGSTFGSVATPIAGSLLRVVDGSTLSNNTISPLMQFSGSTINAETLLFLRGVNTDPKTGLGTDTPLTTGGIILELDPTTVTLSGTGNAIQVDTAVLNASAPIINMISSALTTGLNGAGLMNVFKGNVTSVEVVKLDNSILTVQNGPLLSVTGGSQMTVKGDFANLLNGSKITVLNGPLISVSGNSPGPTTTLPSTLTINGGLVNFGNTGGNQIIVKNDIPITGNAGGPSNNLFPVNVGVGSSITIGPNPVKGDPVSVGNVVSATSKSGISNTGVLIQATGGGKVTIKAP
jgi:hypothetical protein